MIWLIHTLSKLCLLSPRREGRQSPAVPLLYCLHPSPLKLSCSQALQGPQGARNLSQPKALRNDVGDSSHTGRPETAVDRTCLQACPWSGIWEPGFGEGSLLMRVAHFSILFVQKIWFIVSTWFPCGNVKFCYILGRECLYDLTPNRNQGHSF